ncbi:hypothetical protein [Streptomyces sp. NPDC058955]|uniref:hypothetical protein n=1 Tax=unclassified Streptomyces TaxID=2593676 RepID=UPI003646A260
MDRPDEHSALLAFLHRLAWADTGDLRCQEPGHADGHHCLAPPAGEEAFDALRRALVARYGPARNLAVDGDVDPAATDHTGLPLLTALGERVVRMRAWSHGGRWIGLGTVRAGDGVRPVLLVAEGRGPAAELPEGSTWLGGILAATGRDLAAPRPAVDWADVEARLGTALPVDYRQFAEVFGEGAFDGFLRVYAPGSDERGGDLVGNTLRQADFVRVHGGRLWKPYEVYPAPGGLLQWGDTEQATTFYWLTEGTDPDRWPILATGDDFSSWVRFDGTITEFLYRVLTDPHHPFSMAGYFDRHWFESYEEPDPTD